MILYIDAIKEYIRMVKDIWVNNMDINDNDNIYEVI